MHSIIHPKEKIYFAICLTMSILIYLGLILSIVGIVYILVGILVGLIAHGIFIGQLRGNNIRVSKSQFPEVFQMVEDLSQRMGLESTPAIYVIHSDGIFNAFATKFFSRNFVAVYSDVLELAYEQGEPALTFVIGHELAHIKRKHLSMRWLIYPGLAIPFLGQAYSRACEYTCDLHGAFYSSEGSIPGLLTLAAGKKLYRRVDVNELVKQSQEEGGFWVWLSEIISTHPYLPKRIKAAQNYTAIMSSSVTVVNNQPPVAL